MSGKQTEPELESLSRETLLEIVKAQKTQLDALNKNIEELIEQVKLARSARFGRSSEKKDVMEGQIDLWFNEAEALTDPYVVVEPDDADVIRKVRKKTKGKRDADLEGLPVEVIEHTLPEEELREKFGEKGWKRLPDEVYKRVKVQPAVYMVEEHHVAVYAQKSGDMIVKARRPKDLLRNSVLTPSMAATILNAKYVNGIPIYRIAQEFVRNEVAISKQVMANWTIRCAERYLSLIYERMHEEIYRSHVIQADETPVMVSKDGRPANSKSYMWVYRTGKWYEGPKIILFDYQKTRKADHPREFLREHHGVVVCDGYSAYRKLGKERDDITFAGCWAHARRKFTDALKALPKGMEGSARGAVSREAVDRIAAIYHQDGRLDSLSGAERLKRRNTDVRPLVEAFFAWAKEIRGNGALLQGKSAEAVEYCLNQEEPLRVFLEDGEVPMDNNATESALRTFCVHKHAWRMIDTISGAQASAMIYSITETAKANALNPYRYLEHTLTVLKDRIDETDDSFLDDILPWSRALPESCRVKGKATNL